MTVIRKDEDEWWFARHEDGRTGAIPVPYITVVSFINCDYHCFYVLYYLSQLMNGYKHILF